MIWPFGDSPDVAVFTTKSIAFGGQPVLLVTHDEEDGARQFLPREGAGRLKDATVISLREMIECDGTLAELADLPMGWRAWRESQDSPWLRKNSTTQVRPNDGPQRHFISEQIRDTDRSDRRMYWATRAAYDLQMRENRRTTIMIPGVFK